MTAYPTQHRNRKRKPFLLRRGKRKMLANLDVAPAWRDALEVFPLGVILRLLATEWLNRQPGGRSGLDLVELEQDLQRRMKNYITASEVERAAMHIATKMGVDQHDMAK